MPGVKFYEDIPYFLQNTEELKEAEEGKIIGEIPNWLLDKSIFAAAPGIWDLPKGSFHHWIDGLVILVKFQLGEHTVKFSKKFVQTSSTQLCIKQGKPSAICYGVNPQERKGLSKLKPFSYSDVSDSCLGVTWNLGGKNPFLVCDAMNYYRFNPNTLDIIDKLSTIKTFGVNGLCPFTFEDKCTGEMYTVGTSLSGTGQIKYQVLRLKKKGSDTETPKFETICSISSRWYSCASLVRIFCVTKNYIVFVEQPHVICLLKIAAIHLKNSCVKDCLEWKGNEPNKFFVIDKSSGKIILGQKFEVHAEHSFNGVGTINAYEEDETIVLDILSAEDDKFLQHDMDMLRKMEVEALEPTPLTIKRFKIPVVKHFNDKGEIGVPTHLKRKSLADVHSSAYRQGHNLILRHECILPGESPGFVIPRINQYFSGRKYSYFYASPIFYSKNTSNYFGKVCKVNVEFGEVTTWEPEDSKDPSTGGLRYVPNFPIFVPRPLTNGSTEMVVEDDGVVIVTFATVSKVDKNFMVFLDAKTFKEIGRVYFNEKIPIDVGGVLV